MQGLIFSYFYTTFTLKKKLFFLQNVLGKHVPVLLWNCVFPSHMLFINKQTFVLYKTFKFPFFALFLQIFFIEMHNLSAIQTFPRLFLENYYSRTVSSIILSIFLKSTKQTIISTIDIIHFRASVYIFSGKFKAPNTFGRVHFPVNLKSTSILS